MVKNRSYWKKRFEILEQSRTKTAEQTKAEVAQMFRSAERELESKISTWYQRFADNNQISLPEARRLLNTRELAEFRWDVDEYIKHGKENAVNPVWMKQLENASARVHISRLEVLKLQTQQTMEVLFGNQHDAVDRLLRRQYRDGYHRALFEVQKGLHVGWDVAGVDDRTLYKILKKPWTPDGNTFSDRIWGAGASGKNRLIHTVHTELTRNMILGKASDDAIKNLAKAMNASKHNAGRLIMTESAYFSNLADLDAYRELGVEQFEVLETLDATTCELCGELDGKVFPLSAFEVGVTAPPFHPWCRGTTAPYFDDDFGERVARGADGETYHVPSDMTYKEWKKTFVDGGEKRGLQKRGKERILNTGEAPMNVLPRCEQAVIPIEKFTEYALNPEKEPNKATAFKLALGYDLENAEKLIQNIYDNLSNFPAKLKGDTGFGMRYQVTMELRGENGKTANVITGWIDDQETAQMRLTSVYVTKKKG